MRGSTDVVIIGGGIIGCSIAYRLKQEGVQCIVLDTGNMGEQASRAAAGVLAPLQTLLAYDDPYARLLFGSIGLFPEIAVELKERTGIDIEFHTTGTLRVYNEDRSVLDPWIQSWVASGFRAEWLPSDYIHEREPLLSPDAKTVLSVPDEAQVNTRNYVSAIIAAATLAGVDLRNHQEVIAVKSSQHKVETVVTASGDRIACGQAIIAAGCWSNFITQRIGLSLPVFPRKGQVLSLQQPDKPLRHIIFGEEIYLAPKQNGTIIIGATNDDSGYDTHVTVDGLLWLLTKAVKVVPSLYGCSVVDSWAGLRPKTIDSRPILGLAPEWENVVIATGHNGFGITLSAITAREITRLVLTGSPSQMILPFGVERFADC